MPPIEHSQTDGCTKIGPAHCPLCGKGHATFHRPPGGEATFYACADCGKTWRDWHYEPPPRVAGWWAFLRAEYAAGRLSDS